MKKFFFREEQQFSSVWIWIILILALTASLAPTCVAIYSSLILKKPEGENPESAVSLFIILIVLILVYLLVFLLLKKMKLVTEVRMDGLFYRYPPIFFKEKKVSKQEIQSYKIRKYNPVREYGGWGTRYGWGKSGRAFNVKGNVGLQLYLESGKKVLFGTQRPDALLRAMNKMMKV